MPLKFQDDNRPVFNQTTILMNTRAHRFLQHFVVVTNDKHDGSIIGDQLRKVIALQAEQLSPDPL